MGGAPPRVLQKRIGASEAIGEGDGTGGLLGGFGTFLLVCWVVCVVFVGFWGGFMVLE